MRKLIVTLCAVMLMVSFTACTNNEKPSTDVPATNSEGTIMQSESQTQPTIYEPITVADAFMYRGTVTQVETTDDGLLFSVAKAKGTNFEPEVLAFMITDDTKFGFDPAIIDTLNGRFVEVFYQLDETEDVQDKLRAYEVIGMNQYEQEGMVNFNGTVKQIITQEGTTEIKQLLVADLQNPENEVIFNIAPETNFYMNVEEITEGTELNIFHSMAMALSLPPQMSALEVRLYSAE